MTKTKKTSKTKKSRSCVNTLKDIIYTGGTNTFRLIRALKNAVSEIEQLRQEIERLRKERNKARRRVCEMLHEEGYGRSPEEWAERKGWDCFWEPFNEDTND